MGLSLKLSSLSGRPVENHCRYARSSFSAGTVQFLFSASSVQDYENCQFRGLAQMCAKQNLTFMFRDYMSRWQLCYPLSIPLNSIAIIYRQAFSSYKNVSADFSNPILWMLTGGKLIVKEFQNAACLNIISCQRAWARNIKAQQNSPRKQPRSPALP